MPADIFALSSGYDEQLRRIRVEAEHLANQPEIDRSYLLPKRAEEIGVCEKVLKSAVRAVLHERAKRVAAELPSVNIFAKRHRGWADRLR